MPEIHTFGECDWLRIVAIEVIRKMILDRRMNSCAYRVSVVRRLESDTVTRWIRIRLETHLLHNLVYHTLNHDHNRTRYIIHARNVLMKWLRWERNLQASYHPGQPEVRPYTTTAAYTTWSELTHL